MKKQESLEAFLARGGRVRKLDGRGKARREKTRPVSASELASRVQIGCPHCKTKLHKCFSQQFGVFWTCKNDVCPVNNGEPGGYYYIGASGERVF